MERIVDKYLMVEHEEALADPETWKKKCEELGLSGQTGLMEKSKSPIPFLRLDEGTKRVIECLCPTKEDVAKFGKEPIPMEALGLLGLAIHENYFEKIQVWYSPSDPDPFLIGINGNETNLLCRWGTESKSLEQLKESAIKKWMVAAKKSLEEAVDKLAHLETLARAHFEGQYVSVYV